MQGITAIAQRFDPVLILADCIQVTSALFTPSKFACLLSSLERGVGTIGGLSVMLTGSGIRCSLNKMLLSCRGLSSPAA